MAQATLVYALVLIYSIHCLNIFMFDWQLTQLAFINFMLLFFYRIFCFYLLFGDGRVRKLVESFCTTYFTALHSNVKYHVNQLSVADFN